MDHHNQWYFKIKKLFPQLVIGLLALFAIYICFNKLGKNPFENWDEAWYADMTREMLRKREFIVLIWNRILLFDKPPLYIWFSSFFASILKVTEFSVRLPSAIAGFTIITIVIIYVNKRWGLISTLFAFSSLALNNIFIWRTRTGNLDALVSLLIFILFFAIKSKNKYRHYLIGIIFGCIYLTKLSLVAFSIIIYIFHEFFYARNKIKTNWLNYLKVILIFSLISGTWLFLGYLKAGKEFLIYYLFKSDQNVAKITLENLKFDYWSYTYYSLQRRLFFVFLFGIGCLLSKIKKSENFLILMFSLMLLVFLSFSKQNNNWYLMPSMAFWSITIAYGIYIIVNFFNKKKLLVILPLLLLLFYISYKTYAGNIIPIFDSSSNIAQAESAKTINRLTNYNDIVIRTDQLYPTTIYYSDRKILSYYPDGPNSDIFINKEGLKNFINKKKTSWFVGKKNDINILINEYSSIKWNIMNINNEETIAKINYE